MRQPLEEMKVFANRRSAVASSLAGSALILSAPPEYLRNGSVGHPFRQDSNLYYMTGFEEPESIFIFRPGHNPETIMFVREKNAERETWDGFRYGVEGTAENFRMDQVFPIQDFLIEAPKLLKGVEKIYYRYFKNLETDRKIDDLLKAIKVGQGRTGFGLVPVCDSDEFLGEFRLRKTPYDLENLKRACDLTAESHAELMKYVRPGMNEREIHGYFIYQVLKRGAAREGYGSIIAGGANATTLHYVFNDNKVNASDLLLIDAAGEYKYFTSDITRTYPISGQFTKEQEIIYQKVLNVQKTVIEAVKVGASFQSLQDLATDLLVEALLDLGFMTGRKTDIISSGDHKKYYPHGIGHFLGMDVHDAGLYFDKKTMEPRPIEENMTFTIEPGLYFPADDRSIPEKFRGIGVRIEDNIRATYAGPEVMTTKAPKEIQDLSKIIGSA
jgi:Xaa-Pro aminopeptidase